MTTKQLLSDQLLACGCTRCRYALAEAQRIAESSDRQAAVHSLKRIANSDFVDVIDEKDQERANGLMRIARNCCDGKEPTESETELMCEEFNLIQLALKLIEEGPTFISVSGGGLLLITKVSVGSSFGVPGFGQATVDRCRKFGRLIGAGIKEDERGIVLALPGHGYDPETGAIDEPDNQRVNAAIEFMPRLFGDPPLTA
jgi:hypothetical protein